MRSRMAFHRRILPRDVGVGNKEISIGNGLARPGYPDCGWAGGGEERACTWGRTAVQVLHGEARYSGRSARPGNHGPLQVPMNQVIAEFSLDLAPAVLSYVR